MSKPQFSAGARNAAAELLNAHIEAGNPKTYGLMHSIATEMLDAALAHDAERLVREIGQQTIAELFNHGVEIRPDIQVCVLRDLIRRQP